MRESGRAFFLLSSQLSRLDSLDDFLLVSFSRVFLLASTNCCILFSIFLKNETNNKKSCEINTLLSGTTAVGHFHRKVPGQSNCNIHIPYYFPTKSVKNPVSWKSSKKICRFLAAISSSCSHPFKYFFHLQTSFVGNTVYFVRFYLQISLDGLPNS